MIDRLADGADLAIDLLTLGQYGLEQDHPAGPGCERGGLRAAREALTPARRACAEPIRATCSTLQVTA